MKLIVGLGNPGREYAKTRHNAGFMAIDYLVGHFGFGDLKMSERHKAEISEGELFGERAFFVKPQTYMNLSGQAVKSVMGFYKIKLEDLIVIYDDVDLPSGTLRIRPDGSAGGHKGIKSIIEHLGSQNFIRVRLGMHPVKPFRGALEDYVLGKADSDEKKLLMSNIKELPQVLQVICEKGAAKAMNAFN
ncbi:aminoacyl-tRNA hydrolase [Candidatus Peregrinibacteria bacterium]|nr:aminoacyl-tRNA hydrolase [Candidatus Peregrinibacteria bacterium]